MVIALAFLSNGYFCIFFFLSQFAILGHHVDIFSYLTPFFIWFIMNSGILYKLGGVFFVA